MKRITSKTRGLFTVLLALTWIAHGAAAPESPEDASLKSALQELKFQTGDVTLPGGLAKLSLPEGFRYLTPGDADVVLTKLWGNPPGHETLGMVFPAGMGPATTNGWAIVITYSDDGYIKDSDADSIDYDQLLKQMQASTKATNAERKKSGFPTVDLVGWAARPHYDKAAHKMYWAKELKFEDNDDHTLNYNIRVLGRGGVLNLNAVASLSALPAIEASAPQIVALVNFTDGNRYADFKEGTDKVAAYGLAALVAGGIAAKAGFFKVLIAGLIAAKKFIIIGLIAAAGLLKKLLSGRNRPNPGA